MAEEKMTIVDLRKAIAKQTETDEAVVSNFLNALIPAISDGLKKDKQVRINGLGTFKLQWVEPRKSVNVSTGEPIIIEGYQKLGFTPEQSVKDRINEPFANLDAVELDDQGTPMPAKPKTIDPIQKMDEQAMEIKDLLDDIGAVTVAEEAPAAPEMPEAPEKPEVPEMPATPATPATSEVPEVPENPGTPAPPETPSAPQPKKEPKPFRPWLVALITILIFCAALIFGYFYIVNKIEKFADNLNKKSAPVEQKAEQPKEEAVALPMEADTIAEPDSAEIASVEEAEVAEVEEIIPTEEKETLLIETVGEGSRLTWIAKKYYGNKDYWVYIYEANRDKMKNPSAVSTGMQLRIPKLTEQELNWEDPAVQQKLKQMQEKYL